MSAILTLPRRLKLTKSNRSGPESAAPEEFGEKEAGESIHEVQVNPQKGIFIDKVTGKLISYKGYYFYYKHSPESGLHPEGKRVRILT
jgi:hypothetical protein